MVRELYEGIFRRAAAAYPLDYYWFWTPEGWTWSGVKEEDSSRRRWTTSGRCDRGPAARSQAPFSLATCGWVLGPQQDRAMFDKVLPKDVAVSCINRQVGYTPVDAGLRRGAGAFEMGHSLDGRRPGPEFTPALGRADAAGRGRRAALRLRRAHGHPLADARAGAKRQRTGPGGLAAGGVGRCLPGRSSSADATAHSRAGGWTSRGVPE